MMGGGWVPGGSWRRMVCDTAVTCAFDVSRRAVGCRKILTIDWPLTVVDSMCSMLSTVVVRTRSYWVVIRPSISSGFSPVNCHATAITGMLMLGKMSVGVRRTIAGLASRISSATTTKVYGRCRATLTIHMLCRRPTAQSSYCSHGCLPSLSILEDAGGPWPSIVLTRSGNDTLFGVTLDPLVGATIEMEFERAPNTAAGAGARSPHCVWTTGRLGQLRHAGFSGGCTRPR